MMKLFITYGFGYDQRNNFSVIEAPTLLECQEQLDTLTDGRYAFSYSEKDFAGQAELIP
jgi:hypothetical protein